MSEPPHPSAPFGAAADANCAPAPARRRPFTAVVVIHGIGRHVRHENAGKLLEAFELAEARAAAPTRTGVLRDFDPGLEQAAGARRPDVEFMRFGHFVADKGHGRLKRRGDFRLYELNWSPLTKAGLSPFRVVAWLIRSLPHGRGDWRGAPILRLARLHHLRLTSAGTRSYVWATLATGYRLFRGTPGRLFQMAAPRGSADLTLLRVFLKERADNTVHAAGLDDAAGRWDRTRLPAERRLATTRWLAACGIAALAIIVGLAVVSAIHLTTGLAPRGPAWFELGRRITLTVIAAAVVFAAPRLLWFLGRIFSDVRFWASYDQNDQLHEQRRLILDHASDLLTHVASHPDCKRIVIVAHSLGTAIAFDALREVERRNKARGDGTIAVPMLKLSHLFTLGSPIDKLALMFEAGDGGGYRAMSLRQRLRGDLGDPPFWTAGRGRARWINMWDRSDPVCDPLYSPLGSRVDGGRFATAEVENVEVRNTARFDPMRSHTTYFDNPAVVDRILDAVLFAGTGRHRTAAVEPNARSRRARRVSAAAIMAVPPSLLVLFGSVALEWLGLSSERATLVAALALVMAGAGLIAARIIEPGPQPSPPAASMVSGSLGPR